MKTNWQTKKLGEVCEELFAGGDVPKENSSKFKTNILNIPIFSNGEKSKGLYGFTNIARVTKPSITISARGTIGYSEIRNEAFYPAIRLIVVVPKIDILNLSFLKFVIDSIDFAHSGSSIPQLTVPMIKDYPISFPPLLEQQRIVKLLNDAFEKIEKAKQNTEKNLQNAKELFESYLSEVFTNHEWKKETLGKVCEVINRGISPKYIESNGLIILNQRCIRDHKIDFSFSRFHDIVNKKIAKEKFIRIGDVLVNSTGVGTLGRIAQVRELTVKATVDSHVTIVRPIKDKFYLDFFGYVLMYIEKEITKSGEGASGQIELTRNTLKNNFQICYPKSLSEQKSIVAKLDFLSTETKKLESIYKQKLADLEELKKSVLKKAFEGNL